MKTVRIQDIVPIPVVGGELQWRPVRRTLGIEAFGINAYTADADEMVVEEHEHLRAAVAAAPKYGEYAQKDGDLDSIRDDAGFPG